jgi:UDP-N-acetylglucosamine pyrophosphorylase
MKMMSFNTDTQMKNTQMKNTQMKKISATAKERAFENSTLRQFSQFERVLIETTTSNEMNTKTALTVHRADSVSDRKRDRKREREREREERERERRDREQAVSK